MPSLNILLIDDEEDFVTTLAERLELRGIKVRIATDGKAGLRLFKAEPFHAVILDIMMPGLSGLEVLQQMKTFNPRPPVILLTGHGDTADGSRGLQMGAFDYLMKPVDIDDLIKKIDDAAES